MRLKGEPLRRRKLTSPHTTQEQVVQNSTVCSPLRSPLDRTDAVSKKWLIAGRRLEQRATALSFDQTATALSLETKATALSFDEMFHKLLATKAEQKQIGTPEDALSPVAQIWHGGLENVESESRTSLQSPPKLGSSLQHETTRSDSPIPYTNAGTLLST